MSNNKKPDKNNNYREFSEYPKSVATVNKSKIPESAPTTPVVPPTDKAPTTPVVPPIDNDE